MAMREILLLGNPQLLERCALVDKSELEYAKSIGEDLRDTILAFRDKHSWGRAISAPQIGVMKQIVYMEFNQPELFINPVLTELNEEKLELWDDCMSFPDILVKVRRHKACRINYLSGNGKEISRIIENAEAELLQHEIDHLNGILATMRAINGSYFALQSQRHLLDQSGFANQVSKQ